MDASYTGKKIQELRKALGLTQKDLASRLHVTDKAVSKWERGLNFPDIASLEEIAETLHTSAVELLGIESMSKEETISSLAALSVQERENLNRETRKRAWYNVCHSVIVFVCSLYASWVFAEHDIYGLPQVATLGLLSISGYILANAMVTIRNCKIINNIKS